MNHERFSKSWNQVSLRRVEKSRPLSYIEEFVSRQTFQRSTQQSHFFEQFHCSRGLSDADWSQKISLLQIWSYAMKNDMDLIRNLWIVKWIYWLKVHIKQLGSKIQSLFIPFILIYPIYLLHVVEISSSIRFIYFVSYVT